MHLLYPSDAFSRDVLILHELGFLITVVVETHTGISRTPLPFPSPTISIALSLYKPIMHHGLTLA